VLIVIRTYLKLKLCIFLTPLTVRFLTYDICPCNMHESRYGLNVVVIGGGEGHTLSLLENSRGPHKSAGRGLLINGLVRRLMY
jgi:hypothetical protein